jgi:hypothetical protein
VRVIASDGAVRLIEERGGDLYIWLRTARCCGGLTQLRTSAAPPAGRVFRRAETDAPFRLFVPERLGRLPDKLEVEVRRFPRRVEAYWDGCAWVV